MIGQRDPFTIAFPTACNARIEYEMRFKGFLPDVIISLVDGKRYKLYFIDPIRLQQTLEDDVQAGRPYYSEPGLVVVPEVTPAAIRQAVSGLWGDGFFQHLRPLE